MHVITRNTPHARTHARTARTHARTPLIKGMLVLNPDGKIDAGEGLDFTTKVYRKVFNPARVR